MQAHKWDLAIHIMLELGKEIWACEMNFRVIRSCWVQEYTGGEEIKIMTIGSFADEFVRKCRQKWQELDIYENL